MSKTSWPAAICVEGFSAGLKLAAPATRAPRWMSDPHQRVSAGQDRIDQRVRDRLVDKLQHRELDRFLDHVHRAAHRDAVVRRGCGRVRRAPVSHTRSPVPNALNTVTIAATFRLLVSDETSRIEA